MRVRNGLPERRRRGFHKVTSGTLKDTPENKGDPWHPEDTHKWVPAAIRIAPAIKEWVFRSTRESP
jgi:hypothetical protein